MPSLPEKNLQKPLTTGQIRHRETSEPQSPVPAELQHKAAVSLSTSEPKLRVLSNLRAANAAAGVVLGLEHIAVQKDPIFMRIYYAAVPTFMSIHFRECSFCSICL